jgi:hypothetical protein
VLIIPPSGTCSITDAARYSITISADFAIYTCTMTDAPAGFLALVDSA